ncbi:hypothetical protein [Candidatus Nitrosocosmicus hydrocola]|uniref:hypothetical protein n=1 Tax=Candidatus Nitrosocosmicus hydrocola TaxID=1826872 RepID=UPI001E2E71A0|nr:hypothetical protein [Candidatus Nitrosocosmicus hydrocola]
MKNKNIFSSVKELKTTFPNALRLVYFSNPILYIGISVIVFSIFWIVFNMFDQLLFFSPIIYFYIPDDAQVGFVITSVSAALLGVVISMNVYIIRTFKVRLNRSLLSGSLLGIVSSACASCSSIGFLIISTFGGAGIIATGFLTNYQIPLRLLSIVILIWALYVVQNKITKSCMLNSSDNPKNKSNMK